MLQLLQKIQMSCLYLSRHMLITISNKISSSNFMQKNINTWVKMSLNQYFILWICYFYAITDSDTTSYFFCTGKLKTFRKVLSNQTKLKLIKELDKKDKLFDNNMKSAKELSLKQLLLLIRWFLLLIKTDYFKKKYFCHHYHWLRSLLKLEKVSIN